MSDANYKIRNNAEMHFITFAVVEWVDVFTRKEYKDILLESIWYHQKEKGIKLYGWCIMNNHVHLMATLTNVNLQSQ